MFSSEKGGSLQFFNSFFLVNLLFEYNLILSLNFGSWKSEINYFYVGLAANPFLSVSIMHTLLKDKEVNASSIFGIEFDFCVYE